MPLPSVYIETSVVSYLTARLSRDLIVAGHQRITQTWWEDHRVRFRLVTSELVHREIAAGDPTAAAKRAAVIRDVPVLSFTPEATALARELVAQGPLPKRAELDAAHMAVAAVHRVDYLVTWNCTHIANAVLQPALIRVCRSRGFEMPIVCTPEQLSGGD